MRVLHLIDPGSPGGGGCTLRLLAEPLRHLNRVHQDVLIIGHERHVRVARRCGVTPIGSIAAPANNPLLAARAVRRFLGRRAAAGKKYDLVHCWTPGTTLLAMRAAPRIPRLATFSIGPVGPLVCSLLPGAISRNPMPLLMTSAGLRREYEAIDVWSQLISVHPPAVDVEAIVPDDRDALRRRWGVDDETFVIAMLSEPVRWADARRAVESATLLAVAGRDVRLLVHPTAESLTAAHQWTRHIRGSGPASNRNMRRIIIADDWIAEPWRIVAGLDAALLIGAHKSTSPQVQKSKSGATDVPIPFGLLDVWTFGLVAGGRPMPGVMPLLWAMAARVPVVAEMGDAVAGIVQDGQSGLLIRAHDPVAAADRLQKLAEDPTIGHRIGTAAQLRVREHYNVSAYCVRLKQAYEHVLRGRPVHIDAEENPPEVELVQQI